MYLKRLESVGFKSFAERINVEFVPGLTAVVGPNGSGKSNITDAIRWVLGEQSVRSLRGSKMEDIIFQGSDTRKALNVAEVILTLDNSSRELPLDYDEVSITRRVYRSGLSEFYINKQACRLKDIVELFMDSGLGRDAFSIISQGRVEEILSSKAEERRTIFEEAAGVLKYKQRKQKAEYKLAETEENLFRIEDIMHEIEQQLDPLEQQAETAEMYLTYKEQLKAEEVALMITQIKQLHAEWEQLRLVIEDEKVNHITAASSVQQIEQKIEQTRRSIQVLDEEVDVLQEQLLEQTKDVEKYEGQKQLFEERTKHVSSNKVHVEEQMVQLQQQIEQLQTAVTKEQTISKSMKDALRVTEKTIESINEHLSTDQETLAEDVEDQKATYIELLNEQAAKRNELQSTNRQLEQFEQKAIYQRDKKNRLEEKYKTIESRYMENQSLFEKATHVYEVCAEDVRSKKKQLHKNREQFETAQQQLHKYNHHMATLRSRRDVLAEMKEAFQGFFHGVKHVLQARDDQTLQDIHGAVVELVDVPKHYTVAIETILGGQAQHIVVEHDQAARSAIAWLKQTNYGRATFLPLQSIQPRFVPERTIEQLKEHTGFIGIASELVEYDRRYTKAIKHIMGHVLVAKTLKDATSLAKQTNRRFRVVTLDGDVVFPGGSMSGGAVQKKGPSLFTRDHELAEINGRLEKAEMVIADKEAEVETLQTTVASLIEAVEQAEQKLLETREHLEQQRDLFYQTKNEYKGIQSQIKLYEEDHAQFIDDQSMYHEQKTILQTELQDIEQRAYVLENHIADLTEQQATFREDQQSWQGKLHEAEIECAEQRERLKNQQDKIANVIEQQQQANEQYAVYETELKQLLELKQSTNRVEQFEEKIIAATKHIEELQQAIQDKRKSRYEQTTWVEYEERELREEQKRVQQLLQEIQRKEVQENRLDVELENLLSHLQQEYTLTYERATNEYEFVEDLTGAKEGVKQIKQSIDQLGSVNIGAIDEYKRISERYSFLQEQRDDLVEGKQTLYDIINEMDEEMKTRFLDTFNQIKDEFTIVFRELFGGGTARLHLTDPNNLLETGIEIIAQPPGKKLQHLGLLSGGERSLTAIALLFSILRVRPVPFCVLDEVEAALDEANVVRFADYVRQHSGSTQFIVITHRKGTMEKADVLYGITMQESGVSRLVSVRLEETEEFMNTP